MNAWIVLSDRCFHVESPAASRISPIGGPRPNYDAVVCTTAFARAEFDRIHAPNVVTVPLGVDLDQFHPRRHSELIRQRWARREQILLVHCGRLSVEKHAHRSIDTVGLLRHSGVDARLVVVGEGPMRARLERQAARLPVDFTGYIGCRDTVATHHGVG